ncbi:SGNH/GDSL hydrolase family protein [Salinibacter ruber]|uniref:SGNH/GDSL hydrolase family protein n=1 Tax=Salinibacter ruber TaxID=146919 RepID=UPI0021695929|nr:SGNH/GDSL hydrolase family protein [Salinibacter ruber]MCS4119415.1 lysophospholipase L1-like esterase [Salinibacter ruber]
MRFQLVDEENVSSQDTYYSPLKMVGGVVAGLLIGAVVLELGLRLILGLGSPPLLKADGEIGYLFRANQDLTRFTNRVHINQYHQRSEDVSLADSSRFARVLFLGDSVTWGGVLTDQSQTYPELFEEEMGQWCSHPTEALNASAGSWSIGNLRAYAERFGFFGSDLVVLQIGQGDLTAPTSDSSGVGNLCSLPRRPPALALTEFAECYWPKIESRLGQWVSYGREGGGPQSIPIRRASTSSADRGQFEKNMQHLQALVDSIRAGGLPVAVIYNPEQGHVIPEGSPPPSVYERFREWIDQRDIPMLDLQARWDGEQEVRQYYRDYIHLNEQGNAAFAKQLSKFVRAKDLPACQP